MALVQAERLAAHMRGFSKLPGLRQAGLMVGLAMSVALGLAIVLWAQKPAYTLLFGNLSQTETAEIAEILDREGIAYQIDPSTGALLVPSGKLREIRLKLAGAGLPRSTGAGYEILDRKQGFGTSEFLETVRYQRALEGELARTIATLAPVERARVHLAIPKRSAFIRKREKPSASVLVYLYRGRTLDRGQVQAIVHLVSSSVPNMEASAVTVVDQAGRLLSGPDRAGGVELSLAQLDYTHRVEDSLRRRIEEILAPVVGLDRVRAQVVADMDFSVVETTQEVYDPDPKALRSEQVSEQRTEGTPPPMGIPGALSNQPPPAGTTDPQGALPAATPAPVSTSREARRNYELDRTIRHTRSPAGQIKRLSVAVVIDDAAGVDDEGKPVRKPLDQALLNDLTRLVKEAVGFDEQRGDTVHVVNASFLGAEQAPPPPSVPLWREPWFMDVLKLAGGALALLALLLGVLRPVMRTLASHGALPAPAEEGETSAEPALEGATEQAAGLPAPEAESLAEDQVSLSTDAGAVAQLGGPRGYEEELQRVQTLAGEDPRLAARIVKDWVADHA